jgi:hypothetical protein
MTALFAVLLGLFFCGLALWNHNWSEAMGWLSSAVWAFNALVKK